MFSHRLSMFAVTMFAHWRERIFVLARGSKNVSARKNGELFRRKDVRHETRRGCATELATMSISQRRNRRVDSSDEPPGP